MGYREKSIGIIGAGPAGLTLAKLLAEKGFKRIVLLEAQDRVGGKARNFTLHGLDFNLGACYVTLGYGIVRKWLREYGVATRRLAKPVYVDRERRKVEFIDFLLGGLHPLAALAQFCKYLALWCGYYVQAELREDIAAEYRRELAMPAREWFEMRRLPLLLRMCRRAYQVMGYGLLEEVPMLHVFRWVTPTLLLSGMLNLVYEVKNFESLFQKMAADFDVRLNSRVLSVEYDAASGFVVHTASERHHFDVLVCSTYLDEAPAGLDRVNEQLAKLRPLVDYKKWAIRVAEVSGRDGAVFSEEAVLNFPDSWERPAEGRVVGLRKSAFPSAAADDIRSDASDRCYLIGQLYTREAAYCEAGSRTMLDREIGAQGGEIVDLAASHVVRYGPTYPPSAVDDDIVGRMRRMQGRNRLYFTGATFSHESVKNIANFNRYLADRIEHDLSARRSPWAFRAATLFKRLQPFNL